jgi:cytochrome c-type biogenesis protein CcsB
LHHRGFRFFQSSYDQDELGTVLSVSYDPGTTITYIGYILLAFGLVFNFLVRQSRFRTLSKLVRNVQAQKAALLFVLAMLLSSPIFSFAQNSAGSFRINEQHAKRFGELLVQDSQGRIKPMNTFGHEMLNKITRKKTLIGLDANQVMLGMLAQPAAWHNVDMIKIKHPILKVTLGLEPGEKYANFNDFFDPHSRQYKLSNPVEGAQRKKPSQHDKFDKEIIKVDERLSICYMIYMGQLHRIFPKQNDPNNTWISHANAAKSVFGEEQQAVTDMIDSYMNSVNLAINNGNWDAADAALETIINYQKEYGSQVYPSASKIKAEIFFNNVDVFGRLASIYLLAGIVLLIIAFIKVFSKTAKLKVITLIFAGLLGLGFIAQTAGLVLRWYVSGHAPWSNGYESMIYIAWATVLAGFIFAKREAMPLAATSVLAGLTLFVAHLNWMDPQITNLVPVLKSYWLMIHVSLITASYGFLGLGAILAFLTLLLFSFKTKKNANRVELSIKELSMINEQTLIIGLVMLTIGNFLGAVWANESWGRYWGWDPKETWALVTILVYSAIVHFRLIPKLKSFYAFNVGALLAFGSVIMTYFGVNFYLSGLHSYAAGDPLPIPVFVYYTVAVVFLVIILSFRGRKMSAIE